MNPPGPWGIEHLVSALRPGSLCYVSFECALAEWGVISQQPAVLTVATLGASGWHTCEWGRIEFTQVARGEGEVLRRCVQVPGRPLLLACEDLALDDLRLADRNLNLLRD